VLYTTSCKHSLVHLGMGEIIARNMLSWMKLLIKLLILHLVGCLYYCKILNTFLSSFTRKIWITLPPARNNRSHCAAHLHADVWPHKLRVLTLGCVTTQVCCTCLLHAQTLGQMMPFQVKHALTWFFEAFLYIPARVQSKFRQRSRRYVSIPSQDTDSRAVTFYIFELLRCFPS